MVDLRQFPLSLALGGCEHRAKAMRPRCLGPCVLVLPLLLLRCAPCEGLGPGVTALCSRMAGLSVRQRALCRSSPDAMVAIGVGLRLGLLECQHQFRHERWNCSQGPSAFGLPVVVRVASREAAFSLAVQAAAVSWSVSAACARGEVSGCGCAKRAAVPRGGAQRQASPAAAFRWGGCSSDVDFGSRLSRTFLDAGHAGHGPMAPAARMLMDSHNSKAGRKAVKVTLQTECKCHGVSGSCSVKTCWRTLAPFRVVGDHLMVRYRGARAAVVLPGVGPPSGSGGRGRRGGGDGALGLQLALRGSRNARAPRLPRRTDLVFLQGSPNYCERDPASGSLGTAGRPCNRTSPGVDGCGLLCCGRGYNTRQGSVSRQCHCKFHWCCRVTCDLCTQRFEEFTCK